jgi:WhiB family transcriptional regulator, redox-sensing transcriptional regulator
MTLPSTEWMDEAHCRKEGVPTSVFFPEKSRSAVPAQKVCIECPVSGECRDYALATNQSHGVWGGLSERARRRAKKARAA